MKSGLPIGNVACLYSSESTFRGQSAVSAALFIRFLNLPLRNVGQGWIMLIQFPNLPPGNCQLGCSLIIRFQNLPQLGVQHCLYGFRTYLQGIGGRRYSLFLLFLNLPPGGAACL